MSSTFIEALNLNTADKLHLVEQLWDSIADSTELPPVHDWQKAELARRKAEHMANPNSGLTRKQAMKRILDGDAE